MVFCAILNNLNVMVEVAKVCHFLLDCKISIVLMTMLMTKRFIIVS